MSSSTDDDDEVIEITAADLVEEAPTSTHFPPVQQAVGQQIPIAPSGGQYPQPVPYAGSMQGQGPPMPPVLYTPGMPLPGQPEEDSSSNWKIVLVLGLTMALVGVGAFFAGQSTRESAAQVQAKVNATQRAEHARGQAALNRATVREQRAVSEANRRIGEASRQSAVDVSAAFSRGQASGESKGQAAMCEQVHSLWAANGPANIDCSGTSLSYYGG